MEKLSIEYVGENLLLGQIGNISIALAFVAAFVSFVSYCFSESNSFKSFISWKALARTSFFVQAVAVFTLIGTLFYILINQHFEYHYAWQHSNKSLAFKYIFAAFWEGQEGSFLLWTFWLEIIGLILLFTSKEWESKVMPIFALVLVFLVSMVLGIYIGDYHLGSNPFVLTREHPNFVNMPFVKSANYLAKLDGRGLNPALQNYWMTIHPPTLFLGFALTLVPYVYAVAGLWSGKLNEWMKPALPWTFTGIAILGGGILMGGAWAYEALNFGGFWAWDPVENASLVPWLTLVSAGHLMLIHKSKGTNLLAAIVFSIISFVFVLYSTFLTRSGILGDASVHSFTDLGMTGQLLVYLFAFIFLPIVMAVKQPSIRFNVAIGFIMLILFGILFDASKVVHVSMIAFVIIAILSVSFLPKYYPSYFDKKKDDHIYSREFWIFVGSMMLFASAIHLTFATSVPVWNKIFGSKFAPSEIGDYNIIQGIAALIVTFLIAYGQYFKYNQETLGDFFKKILRSFILSAIIVVVCLFTFKSFRSALNISLVFISLFAILSNLDYIIQFTKSKLKFAGSSIAHIGFGMIILGAVVSAGHQEVISSNANGFNLELLNAEFKNNENVMLLKNDTVKMGDYYLLYESDTMLGHVGYYTIHYFEMKNNQLVKSFTLNPSLITNDRMGNVAEPSTKHFWNKDIFTHLTFVEIDKLKSKNGKQQKVENEHNDQHFKVEKGDTIYSTSFYIVFNGLEAMGEQKPLKENEPFTMKLRGNFIAYNMNQESDTIYPIYDIVNDVATVIPANSEKFGIELAVEKINKENVEVGLKEVDKSKNDFIIMQAIIFPGINILWIGCFLMVIGSFIAVYKRLSLNKSKND